MLQCSKRLTRLFGQNVQKNSWLWATPCTPHVFETIQTSSGEQIDDRLNSSRSYSVGPLQLCGSSSPERTAMPDLRPYIISRSCATSSDPRPRSMEFENVMHKRRVFSRVIIRLTTRYKTRIRKLDFEEGSEAENAKDQLAEEYFKDVKDIVGRFKDDMDHVNAATVIHRMGCVAVCYDKKSWMVNAYKDILIDFANFVLQPECLDNLELRQAVMCYWGLATFGPSLMDISLPQSPNETVADCMKKLEDRIRTKDASLRNGNNVCNVIEAAALARLTLQAETLEYLLAGAPSLLSDPSTSPQNVAGLLWGMSKLGLKDEWGAIPVAMDTVTSKHNKLRMDEVFKIVKALAEMDITDYGKFLDETVNRVQVAINYTERLLSAENIVEFAKGLATLNFANHGPIMDYLVNNIKRRDVPLSCEQMEDFKKAADTLGYSLGSLEQEKLAEVA